MPNLHATLGDRHGGQSWRAAAVYKARAVLGGGTWIGGQHGKEVQGKMWVAQVATA